MTKSFSIDYYNALKTDKNLCNDMDKYVEYFELHMYLWKSNYYNNHNYDSISTQNNEIDNTNIKNENIYLNDING